jgi:hypothetical protein
MDNVNRLIHAYKQAPWRTQRQWIGASLLALLLFAMVAALYLSVTARAAIIGRQIQTIKAEIEVNQRVNADLETQIAFQLSETNVQQEAQALGYRPAESDEIEYLYVPGYPGRQDFNLAEAPGPKLHAPTIPPEYTQSLLDWVDQRMRSPALPSQGGW